jgi:hypothetical protein
MKAVFTILAMITSSGMLFAQNAVEQTGSSSGFAEHFKQFSWIYITAFVVLIGVFVAAYFFGWDKKLFKANTHDDGPQLFI